MKKKVISNNKCPHGCDAELSAQKQGLIFLDEALSMFMADHDQELNDLSEALADGTYALLRMAELANGDEE